MRFTRGRGDAPELFIGRPLTGCLTVGLGVVLVLAPGCNEGGERPDLEFPDGLGGEVDAGGAPSSGGVTSSGGQSTVILGGGANYSPGLLTLPFGFMGDQELAITSDPNDCTGRPSGAQGTCHHFRYELYPEGEAWAGLYWLTTYDNWGERPGWEVEEGASRVAFFAKSEPPGAPVTFFAGGLSLDGGYADDFDVNLEPELTSVFAPYFLDLSEATYESGVLGGFGFLIASGQDYSIYIDDIRWE